jgi:hypothetical protein
MELNLKLEKASRINEKDRTLFEKYIGYTPPEEPGINYENSFEYVQMYFNLGKFQGYKYLDKNCLIFFSMIGTKKNPHFKIFKPLGKDTKSAVEVLIELIQALNQVTSNPITLTCLTNEHLKEIKKQIEIKKVKNFEYYLYDLEEISELKGTKWKNVRHKINSFQKSHPKVRIEDLDETNSKKALHFISTWRKEAAAKGFSYIDVDKNKTGARYYQDKIDHKFLWAKIYYLHGKVEAYQLIYKLLTNEPAGGCAHAVGMANNSVLGLSEFSQIDIWRHVKAHGIRYVNDGPSWRPGLVRYKRKFNPCGVQKVIECTV